MSEQDIHAAAERWKSGVYPITATDLDGRIGSTDVQLYLDERRNDAYLLADAYVALLDDTPIGDDKRIQLGPNLSLRIADGTVNLIGVRLAGFRVSEINLGPIKTQGQLRALLLAMGVGHGPQD